MMENLVEVREAIRQALDEEMERDENVFILGEDIGKYNGAYKVTKGLYEKWGKKRVIDTPIAENSFVGLAIGAALCGLKPVVEFMCWDFSFLAADQLISNATSLHYISKGRFSLPIVFRGPNGSAAQVAAQHSHSIEALYANFPGWYVISPSNPYDMKGLLKSAIRSNNPVLFLENILLYSYKGKIPEGQYLIPIGKAKVVKEGRDITLISYGRMLNLCERAAIDMEKKKVSVEVIDLRTIKPYDMTTVASSVRKTHFCLLVEEGHFFGGISAELGFKINEDCFDFLDAPVKRICQRETPLPYSKILEEESLPSVERIIEAIQDTLS